MKSLAAQPTFPKFQVELNTPKRRVQFAFDRELSFDERKVLLMYLISQDLISDYILGNLRVQGRAQQPTATDRALSIQLEYPGGVNACFPSAYFDGLVSTQEYVPTAAISDLLIPTASKSTIPNASKSTKPKGRHRVRSGVELSAPAAKRQRLWRKY